MDQRWEFLAPWWKALKPCISFTLPETATADEYVWQVPDIVLKVTMATRRGSSQNEGTFRKKFQMVQEALALLVAVEHADYLVYDDILTYGCGITRSRSGEELDAAWIAAKFLLDVDVNRFENETDDEAIAYDLVRLCGTHQREHPSEEYLAALSQVAALDKNFEPGEPGVDIKIPVKLQFSSHTRVISDLASRDDAKKLSDIAKADARRSGRHTLRVRRKGLWSQGHFAVRQTSTEQ
ncbi:hypothetical protein PHYSODRAFT_340047 [Phytophthora sojae]|uniref:Uncharacterized protein n=1 Tax=Phytophthora sojae (strain P6497) TaxID=1094619 RepID=G5A8K2_PHYSP|nr:hypothetical protein PHYSODRAFT_340047 [Phytophthora sojae]EGZ08228.1 hypothetical protein PHYSODRAFT_340047 [Phytophthora sojae]|eukprot:XP_009536400.1 hypothetical protein PHYSODRAFT_340047 [Phytophthora sojae]